MVAYAFLVIDDGIPCTYKEAVQSVENEEMNFFLQKSDLGQLPKKKDNWLQVGLCQKGRQS
jgi:hypothetical protein